MTQKEEVYQYCETWSAGSKFTLSEVYESLSHLPCPTVRALLQEARAAGIITFVDNKGLYQAT